MRNNRYPRPHDRQTVYLKDVITGPNIEVGDYTIYNDFVRDPCEFERNNVLYHYPINGDRLIIGKFCSIACGAKFLFTSGNHSMQSLSSYTFPIFFDEWGLDAKNICDAWDNSGRILPDRSPSDQNTESLPSGATEPFCPDRCPEAERRHWKW